jgi:choline dehydrogenase
VARDIIVCAGAINSPKLLMLSGIGNAPELKRHGIVVALNLPSVGNNLQDHPLLYLAYRMKIPTYNLTEGLLQKLAIAANFMRSGEGPISNPFEAMAFLKSGATAPTPDLQLFFSAVGVFRLLDGSFKTAPFPGVTVAVANSYPISTGCVKLASDRPNDPPLIDYTLLGTQTDIDIMVRGFHAVRRIMGTEPIAALVEEEVIPGLEVNDSPTLMAFIRSSTSICYHSFGTCRMGVGSDAVVGPDLRVHGTENLWIADASIVPAPISGNMNASCMMIGVKLGKQLSARRQWS